MSDRQHDDKTGSGSSPSRREFLTRASLLVGGMALMGLPEFRMVLAAAPDSRTFADGSFALELDGNS